MADARAFDWIDYAEFGARFFRRAVTLERVSTALGGLAGRELKFEPLKTGPLGLAEVSFRGTVGQPRMSDRDGELVSFDVTVPVSLELVLRLGHEARVHGDIHIDLALVARAADPLLIVIDIPKVTGEQVRLDLRADGLAGSILRTIDPITPEIRRQVANAVNILVSSRDAVRGRVIDVAARIEDATPQERSDREFAWISYAEFGGRFFAHAVTEKRLRSALTDLDGRVLEIGPLRTGPKGAAEVRATGEVGMPSVTRTPGELVTFEVDIPLALDLVINFLGEHRYRAHIVIHLVFLARGADALLIVVDIPPVTPDGVEVSLVARGLAASALKAVGGVAAQLRAQVATRVNAEIAAAQSRVIDVGARIAAS